MATDPKPAQPGPFNVATVEYLIGLMAKHDLTEVALQEGDQKIRLRKGGAAPAFAPHYPPPAHFAPPVPHPAPAPVQAQTPGTNVPGSPSAPAKKLHEIKSEMVGTFYAKPKPDKDDYVKVGSSIKPDTTVCQIEAMKIFNEIKAEVAGTVAEVCVKNGDPVDFGAVLFRVDTNQ